MTRLRQHLLNADVLEVKHSRLWRVLGRPNELKGDDDEAARLGILPLKRIDDYHSFREVFIRLLRLSKATADDLKRLLIACCCQSIRATSVDVKREYADQFTRLERDGHELEWLKAVVPLIDQGVSLRTTLTDLNHRLARAALDARTHMHRCNILERSLESTTRVQRQEIAQRMEQLRKQRDILHESLGGLKNRLSAVAQQLEQLDTAQRQWESISELEMTAWQERQSELQRVLQETREKLSESGRHDASSLERECERKQRDLDQRTRELSDWESRTAGYLNSLGFGPKQIGTLFALINPDLARASYHDVFGDSEPDSVKQAVKNTLASQTNGSFKIDGITVNTSAVHVPDDLTSKSRDLVVERVRFLAQDVARATALLDVARDIKATNDKLQRDTDELGMVSAKLKEHAEHGKAYANRPMLAEEIASLERQIEEKQKTISTIGHNEADWAVKLAELNSVEPDLKRWETCRSTLTAQCKEIQISDAKEEPHEPDTATDGDALRMRDQLLKACERLEELSRTLATLEKKRNESAGKLLEIQHRIAAEARRRQAPRVAIFDQDIEREWRDLQRQRDALGESEQHLNTQWNAMFKSLAGELDLLRRSVAEIKKRASRINADLKHYRVSNLERVELFVDHDTGAYTVLERMTSPDSMFLNEREVEDAKRELRQWIMDGKTIELRELFTIRIRIQNQGESRAVEVASLDVIGSQGTGMTAKVMIYLQLLRSIIDDRDDEYQMHFYLDEIGSLDDRNLRATAEMAFRRGFTPITAEPGPRAEALAHPEVRIYHLGRDGKSFEIVQELTYIARTKREARKTPQ